MEVIREFFTSGDVWTIILKTLLTVLISAGVGLFCTLIGQLIAKNKNSKIMKYAIICVEAAEQKFPNEGTKMGPEKMTYVMDQMAIKFPKIKSNQYLYNIVEAAVYKMNSENARQKAIEDFEQKYGEKPLAVQEEEKASEKIINVNVENIIVESAEKKLVEEVSNTQAVKEETSTKLSSF